MASVEVDVSRLLPDSGDEVELVSFQSELQTHPAKWLLRLRARGPDLLLIEVDSEGMHESQRPGSVKIETMVDEALNIRAGLKFAEWTSNSRDLSAQPDWRLSWALHPTMLTEAGYTVRAPAVLGLQISFGGQGESMSFLSRDFGAILDSPDFSDMTVAVGEREFKTHCNVLAARSSVLKRMVSSDMSEGISRRLELHDIDSDTALAFLQFLYSGEVTCSSLSDHLLSGSWFFLEAGFTWPPCRYDFMFLPSKMNDEVVLRLEGQSLFARWANPSVWTPPPDGETTKPVGNMAWMWRSGRCIRRIFRFSGWQLRCLTQMHVGDGDEDDSDDVDSGDYSTEGEQVWISKVGEAEFAQFWGRLLLAADKYDVAGLAALCVKRMLERISPWSATIMLRFACQANNQALKQDIMRIMTLTAEIFKAVKDLPEFYDLDADLRDELTEVFLARGSSGGRQHCPRGFTGCRGNKRGTDPAGGKEFPDGHDWPRLSNAQLRRACAERGLTTGGTQKELVALLRAQESGPE